MGRAKEQEKRQQFERHLQQLQAGAQSEFVELTPEMAAAHLEEMVRSPGGPSQYPLPKVYLRNPSATPSIDRGRVQPAAERQAALGFNTRPKNINDLSVGDAGPSRSFFRRAQLFASIGDTGGPAASELVYNIPIAIATSRSMDTRPRFWHVSFFAISAIADDGGAALAQPLTEYQIAEQAGRTPTQTTLKGRIQVHDESGSRFVDVNVHGTASMSIYAYGVTAYFLLPSRRLEDGSFEPLGYEVDVQNPDSSPGLTGFTENTLGAARIVGLSQNDTKLTNQITRTVRVPSGEFRAMRVPPGSRRVRLYTTTNHPGGFTVGPNYDIGFATDPLNRPTNQLGRIELLPGTFNTDVMNVPNATFITFNDQQDTGDVDWVAVFEVEA